MNKEIETIVIYCYKCGEITRRPNIIEEESEEESEDRNMIDNIAHKHIQENPGHIILVGIEIYD